MPGLGKGLPDIPEWMALQLASVEEETLKKTQEWNTAADGVRPLRPEDLELAEGTYGFDVSPGAFTIVSSKAIPAGLGIQFAGWFCDGDLGNNGYLRVAINGVKRQEISARVPYRQRQNYVLCLEQIAYARQHDKVTLIAFNSTGAPVTCTVFPIAFVAGPRKTLLIE
ncbi:MAG: hypothetical protein QXG97_04195 [Nitrososphaerota archaeon]